MRTLTILTLLLLSACSPQLPCDTCTDATPQSCNTGDSRLCPGGLDTGLCKAGVQLCEGGKWSDCKGAVDPVVEKCDGRDNDCDGRIDNGKVCGVYPSLSGRSCLFVKRLKKATCDSKQACQCYITPDGQEWSCFGVSKDKVKWMTLTEIQRQCGRDGQIGYCGHEKATCLNFGRERWTLKGIGFLERVFPE